MAMRNYYASIVVVEIHSNDRVTIESISVSKNECVLSGAWNLSLNEKLEISNIISGKLVIALGDETLAKKTFSKEELKFLDLSSFLEEASNAAHDAMAAYEVFKSEDLKKRKNMVEPSFFDWPETLNLNDSAEYLDSLGKMSASESTPSEMKKTLSAARLVKFLIEKWQMDEQERVNRKYVEGADAEITILPTVWLKEFVPL
jgi:hypothetical protein